MYVSFDIIKYKHNEKQKVAHRRSNSKIKYQNRKRQNPLVHKYMTAHFPVLVHALQ